MKTIKLIIAFLFLTQFAFSQKAIFISKSGEGKPIIFLPGFTTPGSVWNETIKNLDRSSENHVVSYAGFNGMEPIGTPWYSPIKAQLIDYIKSNNLKNLTLIGHSMGGNLAIDLSTALPEYIEAMILVETIPAMREMIMPGVPASSLQYDSPYNQQTLAMSDEAFTQMATMMAQNMTNNPSKIELLTKWMLDADRETYVYGFTDLLKLDQRDQLLNIETKTLILGASFPDKETVKSNYEKQYANLKNKEMKFADDSKHFIMFDQAEWLYLNINNYLQ